MVRPRDQCGEHRVGRAKVSSRIKGFRWKVDNTVSTRLQSGLSCRPEVVDAVPTTLAPIVVLQCALARASTDKGRSRRLPANSADFGHAQPTGCLACPFGVAEGMISVLAERRRRPKTLMPLALGKNQGVATQARRQKVSKSISRCCVLRSDCA